MIVVLASEQSASGARTKRSRSGEEHLADIQRRRIISAVVKVVDAYDVEGASIARIVAHAGVSRKTFYGVFDNRNDCVLAAIERALTLAAQRARPAVEAQERWVDRVRVGLLALLQWCDDEPQLARLCVLHSATAGPRTLARRCEVLEGLAHVVDEGRKAARRPPPPPLTAEGLVNGAFGTIHARLLKVDTGTLTDLLNPLMSFIVLPYLGAAAARRELRRPLPAAPVGRRLNSSPEALEAVNIRLTYRTVRVLAAIAAQPGLSNAQASELAGVADQGQISKLLGRLARLEYVENKGEGQRRGGANAWYLTPRGKQLERTVGRELPGVGP